MKVLVLVLQSVAQKAPAKVFELVLQSVVQKAPAKVFVLVEKKAFLEPVTHGVTSKLEKKMEL